MGNCILIKEKENEVWGHLSLRIKKQLSIQQVW